MLQPLHDYVLVKQKSAPTMTPGGIVLPDQSREKPRKGTVVKVGPGRLDDAGNRIAMNVQEGDVVLYQKYAGTDLVIDDDDYIVLRESDILAIEVASHE